MPHEMWGRCGRVAFVGLLLITMARPVFAQVAAAPIVVQHDLLSQVNPPVREAARPGAPTEAEGGPVVQAAIGQPADAVAHLEPFGASLFSGAAMPMSDAANPDYEIQPGDRIGVSSLGGPLDNPTPGAAAVSNTPLSLVVDPQGSIFLPEIGVIHVAGVRADALQATVEQAARHTFTNNVRIYAVLLTTHRVGVFVTGFVAKPGRYAGAASDTVLDYLVRAGGVDPSRGSYRDIKVLRDGRPPTDVDLYTFLLTGVLPKISLREGDTILVGRQTAMVAVQGAVRNNYLFELGAATALGDQIVALARPLPSATDVVLTGSRETRPTSSYLSLNAFSSAQVLDQDRVTFVGDRVARTVQVRVEGSRIGPSYLVLPTNTGLPAALAQVQVDPALADLASVYILRRSAAEQQTRATNEALDRLQRALFLAVSPTSGVSQIRASEAQLISSYIQRARTVVADGRIVASEDGFPSDLRLEDDDVIVIPRRSQLVLVSGEVLAPQAVLFHPSWKREDYIKAVGGYSERGRANGPVLIRRANGALVSDRNAAVRPGDELVILPYIDPKHFQMGADILSLFYQVAIVGAVIHNVN